MRRTEGPLADYARKRDFSATPEPPAGVHRRPARSRFVVQKHRASRLHYDFRLEAGGVLASWALPKGPVLDPRERRLAMKVEDHPVAYRTFEGVIPAGQYGAGEVIVWDAGTYRLAEGDDAAAAIAAGKIKFVLAGTKLRGMFTLVRIKPKEGERGDPWLLIKDHDEAVDANWDPEAHPQSVTSGKTLAAVKANPRAKQWTGGRAADPFPRDVTPMLATPADAPFDDPDWLFEVKWDGYRALAAVTADGKVALTSRNGLDLSARFPALAGIAAGFTAHPLLVDGEICVLDADGKSSFGALHDATGAPTFVAFDLLYADGRDVRALPLEERKARLEELVVPGHGVLYARHVLERGRAFFAVARDAGLEGIVAKRRSSPYRSRRSPDWRKIKAVRRQEFVVGGWTEPRGSRRHFGALLLGIYERRRLVFAGQVGTGFDARALRDIAALLRERATDAAPFAALPATDARAHFVRPELVAEVTFTEWTRDGLLRHPVFVGLRDDKPARDVRREA